MLLRKLWRTMGQYKAQFISMVIMIALASGVFIGFNMEWVSIEENTGSFFEDTGFADYRIVSEKGFSSDDAKKIEGIDGVWAVSRYLAVNAEVKGTDGDSLGLTVTENEDVSGFVLTDGEKYNKNSKDGIWLSDKYADANGVEIGDSMTLIYSGMEITAKVRGLIKSSEYLICVRDESQIMPDYSTYGFAYISPALYEKTVGMDYYPQINVISGLEKDKFSKEVNRAMSATSMILTKDEVGSYAQAQGESDEGKTMGSVLPVMFLLIAVLTMVTTMHRLCAKEKTQIGTLKALGFKNRRILRHYTSYAFMVGIVGCSLGTALGYGVAWYIMNPGGTMGTYLDMPDWKLHMPWFCWVILIGIIVLLTLIGFLSVKQMLRGSAADSLRPYTPSRVKPMAIERTGLFHKLSFGTRWNMRDVTRHKSRTAMSLLGIVGCMIITVAAMGMRDTMSAFLDMYYDGALGYSSRIYMTQDRTQEQFDELLDKYDGDWSSSVAVQISDETVSLDIYSLDRGLIRFPDKSGGYAEIGDSGAYICMRIAEEYGLKTGDSFKLSPFGTDDEYTLKVAGIIRSVSKSIVVSPGYADSLGIKYSADSVYTASDKSDIAADTAVKSVQSRQAIMDSFDSFIGIMNSMIYIMVAGAMILGIVVLYNLGVMSYAERYREMATLKVVGFKDRKIGSLLIGQNVWLTLVGVIIGLPCGIGTLGGMLKALASEYEMRLAISWQTCLVSVLLTFGVSLLVSLMVARKNKKIDMVEALKGAE